MSTNHATHRKHDDADRHRHERFESVTPREQLLGMLVFFLVLLPAVALKSIV